MDVDDYVLALLRDGGKHFKELETAIVPRICAKQTLVKHLQDLQNTKKISKRMFGDRTTKYFLLPESLDRASDAKNIVTLELLIDELDHKTRKQLELEELEPQKNAWRDFFRRLEPTKNRPKISFGLHLDKATLKTVELIQSPSELAAGFEDAIRHKLKEIKLKMPGTIQDEKAFMQSPRDWHETRNFSRKMSVKHGLRFMLYSYYDGEEYKRAIVAATKDMERLERGHKEDISFLNELNVRCYYSSLEHYCEQPAILEDVLRKKDILRISDPYRFLEDAFWYHQGDGELVWLEVALVSEGTSTELSAEVLKKELRRGALEIITSPYDVISNEDYYRMKLPLLSEVSRARLVKNFLNVLSEFLKEMGEHYSNDYHLHSEDYILAIDLLSEKLNINESLESENLESPVMNFRFQDQYKFVDFSDQPIVRNFTKYRRNGRSKKWLEKCLSLGLPIFRYIPFKKLGFEVRNIL